MADYVFATSGRAGRWLGEGRLEGEEIEDGHLEATTVCCSLFEGLVFEGSS